MLKSIKISANFSLLLHSTFRITCLIFFFLTVNKLLKPPEIYLAASFDLCKSFLNFFDSNMSNI